MPNLREFISKKNSSTKIDEQRQIQMYLNQPKSC
jgi:hypothetical protein